MFTHLFPNRNTTNVHELEDGNDKLYDIQQLSELKTHSPVKKSSIIKTNTLTKFSNSKNTYPRQKKKSMI